MAYSAPERIVDCLYLNNDLESFEKHYTFFIKGGELMCDDPETLELFEKGMEDGEYPQNPDAFLDYLIRNRSNAYRLYKERGNPQRSKAEVQASELLGKMFDLRKELPRSKKVRRLDRQKHEAKMRGEGSMSGPGDNKIDDTSNKIEANAISTGITDAGRGLSSGKKPNPISVTNTIERKNAAHQGKQPISITGQSKGDFSLPEFKFDPHDPITERFTPEKYHPSLDMDDDKDIDAADMEQRMADKNNSSLNPTDASGKKIKSMDDAFPGDMGLREDGSVALKDPTTELPKERKEKKKKEKEAKEAEKEAAAQAEQQAAMPGAAPGMPGAPPGAPPGMPPEAMGAAPQPGMEQGMAPPGAMPGVSAGAPPPPEAAMMPPAGPSQAPPPPVAPMPQPAQKSFEKSFSMMEARRVGEEIGVDWDKISLAAFHRGMNIELEHGKVDRQTDVTHDDPFKTGEIALAHLKEHPDYYSRSEGLPAMERRLGKACQDAIRLARLKNKNK